jgi:hypothetical protein
MAEEQERNILEDDHSYASILKEHNVGEAQRRKRVELLKTGSTAIQSWQQSKRSYCPSV